MQCWKRQWLARDALFLLTHGRNSLVKSHGLQSVERVVVHEFLHHWLIRKKMRHPMHNRSDACFMPIGMITCGCHLPMINIYLHLMRELKKITERSWRRDGRRYAKAVCCLLVGDHTTMVHWWPRRCKRCLKVVSGQQTFSASCYTMRSKARTVSMTNKRHAGDKLVMP